MPTIDFDDRYQEVTPASSTDPITLDFPIANGDDLTVLVNGTETLDFTVSANFTDGVSEDAVVTIITPDVASPTVEIVGTRNPARTMFTVSSGHDLVSKINAEIAQRVIEIQELARDRDLSLRVPYGDTISIIPSVQDRAGKFLGFTSSGDVMVAGDAPSVQYQGAFTTANAPTTRLDGSALEVGDLYFDTDINRLKVWDGSDWITGVDASTTIDIVGMVSIDAVALDDEVPVYDDSEAANRKATVQKLWNSTSLLAALTAPAVADTLTIHDDDASAAKRITLPNLLEVIDELTEETSIEADADFVAVYDTTAGVVRKVKPENLVPSGGVDVQEFTASGTWNKPSGATWVRVFAWGAGGSGRRGGGDASGGGGGACVVAEFAAGDLSSSETVTIGAGGAAVTGSNGDGNAGGNTTFGSHLTAYGGGAGANGGGGGGGGSLSAGEDGSVDDSGDGGGPDGGTSAQATGGDSSFGGGGAGTGGDGGRSHYGGGGGGADSGNAGGASFYGGAGGGANDGDGGVSLYGGNGGDGDATGPAGDGSQPGGGGGASNNGDSGAGGDGQVIVTTWLGSA